MKCKNLKKLKIFYLAILGSVVFAGCCSLESSPPQTSIPEAGFVRCDEVGMVVDMSGLDGCGFLIVKQNGDRLIPLSIPDNFELKDSQMVWFTAVSNPVPNACMAGQTVDITCITEAVNGAESANCQQTGKFAVIEESFAEITNQDFRIFDASVVDGILKLQIGYSGCSPDRDDFQLWATRVFQRTTQNIMELKLTFSGQPCEAFFMQTVCFDLSEVTVPTTFRMTDNTGEVHSIKYIP